MRMILFGPPGSGKGTQAKLFAQRLGLAHIATGDILREAIRLGTAAGKKADAFMKKGQLAPDELVNELVAARFRREDRPKNFVMDGYPRTLTQATAFDEVLAEVGLPVQAVIFLMVDDNEIVRRMAGRWICPKCQTPYHLINNPPKKPGHCDVDNEVLVQRADDKEQTVRSRQKVYHQETEPLAKYYREQGILHEVAGRGDIEGIYTAIDHALKLATQP
jgi:adenylate kinase